MSGSGDLLSTGVSGLVAFQRNLAVTGHNITNVNTEGYTRQTTELATRQPNINANGFVGTGVTATTVQRVYDQFLFDQVTARNSSYNQVNTLQTMASRVDDFLGDAEAGLDPALQRFFNSLQDVANNPTSVPARQVLLSEAENLADRFQALDQRFEDMRSTINSQLEVVTSEVTGIAEGIAELNQNIILQQGLAGGQPPNDLLDQRDGLVNRLSELVAVRTVEADDGSLNVFIGNGQTLVLGTEASRFDIGRNSFDATQYEIQYTSNTASFPITDQISGGILGGLLEFRDKILDTAQNSLGRIAVALSDTVNTQHALGDDLSGNAGGLFFAPIAATAPEVLPSSYNNPASGTVSVTIDDTNLVQPSEYQLTYDGATFSLVRLEDNTVVDSGFTVADFPRTLATDGITMSLAGGVAAGDSFLVRPVRQGAADLAVALTDPAQFAAAANGSALGDNSNALAMASMQQQKLMGNGSETYQTSYGRLIATVGVRTNEAKVNASAQKVLLQRAQDNHASVSGVNLDEEAANLVKYQQAYQAAAQVIRIADEVFQTLLGATSR
jgi:flagellar hook-associated protein 1 FlgK